VALGLLAYLPSYSYSEEVFGSTQNAAGSGFVWDMTNVLPAEAGLQVDSVFYRYTTQKVIEDNLIVYVQNRNAEGPGYIFRSADDWSGLPGNTLTRLVPVPGLEGSVFGEGSIETEGFGTVSSPTVIYNYSFDPCFDPQSSPACPGYRPELLIPEMPEVIDPLNDQFIQDELERKASLKDQDQEDRDRRRMAAEKKQDRLEKALGAVNSALMTASAEAKAAELFALSMIPTTYVTSLPSGTYEDTLDFSSKKLPDNNKGRRVGLAQQVLHEKMVDSQYD